MKLDPAIPSDPGPAVPEGGHQAKRPRTGPATTDPSEGAPSDSKLRGRLQAIQEELVQLFFDFFEKRQVSTGLEGKPRETTLNLSLRVAPHATTRAPDSEQLYRQVKQAAHLAADRSAVFPSGHVYCHWCRSFTCLHSTPPEPRAVFAGYSPTGQPVWREFSAVILERGDPRIEFLFADHPGVLPLVQSGRDLASQQLDVYGKRSPIYRILGQVILGYLDLPRKQGNGREPFAITFQAVEVAGGTSPAHLNVLGRLANGTPAAEALEESFDPRLLDALRTTRLRLAEISLIQVPRRRRSRERQRRVFQILRLLSKNFERIFRQGRRRTRHSQSRHHDRQRPTSVALQDALVATTNSIYRDVREKTWIVIGPKNRVHVFNDEAMHITSVVYPGETVRQRTQRGKWLNPAEEQIHAFLDALRRRSRDLGNVGEGS